MPKKQIVVVGGGFAGLHCAKQLLKSREDVDVILLSRSQNFLFYPMLIKLAVSKIEARDILVNLKAECDDAQILTGELTSLSPQSNKLRYRSAQQGRTLSLDYDELILATGSRAMVPEEKSIKKHAITMHGLRDALKLRFELNRMFERCHEARSEGDEPKQQHIAVVGGGYTGCELAGQIAALIKERSLVYKHLEKSDFKVHIVEGSQRLLSGLDEKLGELAKKHLKSLGIEIYTNTKVASYDYKSKHISLEDGSKVACDCLVWSGGIAAPEINKDLNLDLDDSGFIKTKESFQTEKYANIWAIGDCAVNRKSSNKEVYAPTAQMAQMMGQKIIKNLVRKLNGEPILPVSLFNKGMLIPLGDNYGLIDSFGIQFGGRLPWLMASLYYPFQMPTFTKKLKLLTSTLFAATTGSDPVEPLSEASRWEDFELEKSA